MNQYSELPQVIPNKNIALPHFPTRLHAAVFRLWETVSAEQIAKGLDIPLARIQEVANDLGLPEQKHIDIWKNRGYITTIRNAWHILPYDQLLGVLGWDEKRLALCLKEDDFLFIKLGNFKPDCPPVRDEILSDEQKLQCQKIKKSITSIFSGLFEGVAPFSYFDNKKELPNQQMPCFDGLRMVYSFCGLYANVLDEDIENSYPE